jgi:hypothetical protein
MSLVNLLTTRKVIGQSCTAVHKSSADWSFKQHRLLIGRLCNTSFIWLVYCGILQLQLMGSLGLAIGSRACKALRKASVNILCQHLWANI